MTNFLLKGSALGALAAALGLTALPASAAPAVDFDAPMTAIDVGTANDDAKLAQDRDQYQRSRGERGERRQVFRQQRSSAPNALPFKKLFVMELSSFPLESRPTIAARLNA